MKAFFLGLLCLLPAPAYIEALYPLQQFITESDLIAELVVEKVDATTKTATARLVKALKGRSPYEQIRLNLSSGQEWHTDAVLPHLVPGAPLLLFTNPERRGEIYLNRFFLQFYGDAAAPADKAWWTFTHIEVHCNRTYNGPADELTRLVAEVLAGRAKAPAADAKLPVITKEAVRALPVWGRPLELRTLPACFRKRDASKPKAREADGPADVVKGIVYEYFEGVWETLPDFDTLKAVEKGEAAQIDLSKAKRSEQFALRFRGFVEVPRDGRYVFHTVSDDGSKLFIGDEEIVNNDGLHGPDEKSGEILLKAGRHALTVVFFENAGGEALEVSWEGPDLPKAAIPAAALWRVR